MAAMGGLASGLPSHEVRLWPEPLRRWAMEAPALPVDLGIALREPSSAQSEVLAQAYERLVGGRNRRRLGTFFTPPAIVDFMLECSQAQVGAPAVVIDPGAGVGAFSLAARRRWPKAEVYAVDVNVVTLGLLAAQTKGEVTLVLDDYLSWATGPEVPTAAAGPRLWIGNPPYTRHQELSPEVKRHARLASKTLVTSGLASLSAYFLAVTLAVLAPDDGMCFLLPGSWTGARYGQPVREALRRMTRRRIQVHGFASDVEVFPGTRVTAMIVTVGPVRSTAQILTTSHARVTKRGVFATPDQTRGRDGIDQLGRWLWQGHDYRLRGSVTLGDVARIRRGVATGANAFFLLTDRERASFPAGSTLPAVRRLRNLTGDALSATAHDLLGKGGERRWLLYLADPNLLGDPIISKWLDLAKEAEVHKRFLPSHREPWYLVEKVVPPDVIVSPMGKGRLRAVVNQVRAIPANALYGVYLHDHAEMAEQLVAWLNGREGQRALLAHARPYGSGLFKLEPRDLAAVRIPRHFDSSSFDAVRQDNP